MFALINSSNALKIFSTINLNSSKKESRLRMVFNNIFDGSDKNIGVKPLITICPIATRSCFQQCCKL